eukprot:Hpha_TRINITY_DN16252_c0_g10::TRINITY_DN16252_c0_g10_i1::g.14980::m.14980/K13806/DAGL; sn1-specific diacylglycerol lipase
MLHPGGNEMSIVSLATDCLEIGALFGGLSALSDQEHELEEEDKDTKTPVSLRKRFSFNTPQPVQADRTHPPAPVSGLAPVFHTPRHSDGPPIDQFVDEDDRRGPSPSPLNAAAKAKQAPARERWGNRRAAVAGVLGGTTGRMMCIGLRVSGVVTEVGFLATMACSHTLCWCLRRGLMLLAKLCRMCGANRFMRQRLAGVFTLGLILAGVWLVAEMMGVAPEQLNGDSAAGWIVRTSLTCCACFMAPLITFPTSTLSIILFTDEALWFIDKFNLAMLRMSYIVTHGITRWLREALLLGRHLRLSAALKTVGIAALRESFSVENRAAVTEINEIMLPIARGIAAPLRLDELYDALRAITALQRVSGLAPSGRPHSVKKLFPPEAYPDEMGYDFGCDFRRAFRIAVAVYGHTGLKFLGILPYADFASNNARAAKLVSGLPTRSVVVSDMRAKVYQPAFIVWRDDFSEQKSIIVGIRGSVTLADWLTDFIAKAEPCELMACPRSKAHAGMLRAARCLSDRLLGVVTELLLRFPEHKLIISGHSLGAGTAAILGALWLTPGVFPEEARITERTRIFAFGVPPTVSPDLAKKLEPYVTSIICGPDIVPRLSMRAVFRCKDSAFKLWRERGAARGVLDRCERFDPEGPGAELERQWAQSELERLAVGHEHTTELCIPGRLLWGELENDPDAQMHFGRVEDVADLHQLLFSSLALSVHMPQNYGAPFHALPEL